MRGKSRDLDTLASETDPSTDFKYFPTASEMDPSTETCEYTCTDTRLFLSLAARKAVWVH